LTTTQLQKVLLTAARFVSKQVLCLATAWFSDVPLGTGKLEKGELSLGVFQVFARLFEIRLFQLATDELAVKR